MTDYDYALTAVRRVVDGDTYDVTLSRVIDFGFYLIETKQYTVRVRLRGVDTPERLADGYGDATDHAARWLAANAQHLRARTYKADSFGRWLADIYNATTGDTLADELLSAGVAVPWRRR